MKNFRILLFFPNETLVGVMPPTLALLAACLKQDGFDVKLFDCSNYKVKNALTNDQMREKLGHVKKTEIDQYIQLKDTDIYEDFVKIVKEWKPNLLAFNLIDSTIKYSYEFIKKVEHLNIPTIAGGIGSTFNYEMILNSGLFTYACIGEGEEALVELCNKLLNGEDTTHIRNIAYKDKDGNIVKNPLRPLIDINTLPFHDYSIYEDWRFYRPFRGRVIRILAFNTDRGCPYGCTFCAGPVLKKIYRAENNQRYYREKDADQIFNELKYLIKRHNINFISFLSETFLLQPNFNEFAERYKKEINLPFTCQSRLDTFTEEKTRLLAEMGCQNVSVGLEHGSEKVRKELLKKMITDKSIVKAFKLFAKYDITPTINNVIGLPDETREQIFETVELNRKVLKILKNTPGFNNFIFIPFSGTELRDVCIQKGYVSAEESIPFSFFKESLLTMPSITKEQIKGLEKTLSFYITMPKKYWPQIKIAEQDNEEGEKMFDKLIQLKHEKGF